MDKNQMIMVGWREHVALPDLDIDALTVKIDTGARTSALHAYNVRPTTLRGRDYVEFGVDCESRAARQRHVLPVHATRNVKNSAGTIDVRFSVMTALRLGPHVETIEMTLADRTSMRYDMILGRRALRTFGVVVDPDKSFILGKPDRLSRV